jgi:uncharacterized Zn-binding protein involved in type VI secretion
MSHPICLGDPLNNGGQVTLCALAATHGLHGKPFAVLGDQAWCAEHQGTFAFVEGHPRRRMAGLPVVMQGHLLSCGCHAMAAHALSIKSA